MDSRAEGMLFGLACGDALGVPFEFKSREYMDQHPVTGMAGYGTWNQPPGTWSDDSSLTFCLAEALTEGYELEKIAQKFILWRESGYWAASDKAFDIGLTTDKAISRLKEIIERGKPEQLKQLKGSGDEFENGNGSLMRILPLVFEIKDKDLSCQFEVVWENSALTHRHIRAAMCCMVYLKIAEFILDGKDVREAYFDLRNLMVGFWDNIRFPENERQHLKRVVIEDIGTFPVSSIDSGGYVIASLEASLWCLLSTQTFKDAVITAVNLGRDTDTTAAITGGLAGLYYGIDEIPMEWIELLARKAEIEKLAQALERRYS